MTHRLMISIALLVLGAATAHAASFVQEAYIKPSNTQWIDNFGHSVAIDGDTAIVGSTGEDSSATGVNGNGADNSVSTSGAAYIFVRDGSGVWTQQAYLKASDPTSNAQFGWSVAISGDTAVVGALAGDAQQTGVAYVFVRDGSGNWSQQGRLTASNAQFDDQFGFSVSISGDTVVVGANREDSAATGINGSGANNSLSEAGAAYVFVRDGSGNWSEQAYLKASNTGNLDNFGISVSISGDTAVVGASSEDSNATGVNGNQADNSITAAGAAYVFVRDGSGNWTQQAYLKPPVVASNFENFGVAVSISGDTLVVGAVSEDSGASGINGDASDNSVSGSGAGYVFVRDGSGNWSQQAYLKASNPDSNDNFGETISISGDRIVVGAKSESSSATGINGDQSDNSASAAGAAYVFERDGTTWSQTAYVKASNAESGDLFGLGVAVSDDLVLVGARREDSAVTGINGDESDNSYSWAGAAYAFASIPTYSVGGSVSGLVGSGLVLRNNGGDDLTLVSDGPFTFPTELASGATYDVSVHSQPTGPDQICSVTVGTETGTITNSDVNSVEVICTTNQPPTANNDSASVDEDASATIDVAANDTDTDGNLDPTTTNNVCGTCSTPSNGGLANNGDGTFDYTPNADFFGADSFVYEICDTDGACDTATVDITVDPVNDPPSFSAGADPVLPAGTSGPQSIASWPQNIDLGPGETQLVDSYAVTTISDPNGVLSGSAAISTAGELSFTLSGASGTAQLEATLTDDGGTPNGGNDTSTPVAFSITVQPPSADTSIEIVLCTDRSAPAAEYAYGLRVSNQGPDPADGAAVTHTPIAGATVTSISDPNCLDTGTAIDCDLGTLAPGTEFLIGIVIQAPPGGAQSLTMAADIIATTDDPNATDNSDSETVEIIPGLVTASGFESCTPP